MQGNQKSEKKDKAEKVKPDPKTNGLNGRTEEAVPHVNGSNGHKIAWKTFSRNSVYEIHTIASNWDMRPHGCGLRGKVLNW